MNNSNLKKKKSFAFIRSDAEEAATREDYFYARTARRFGGIVCQNALPGYIHARRSGAEDQSPRVPRAGELTNKSKLKKKKQSRSAKSLDVEKERNGGREGEGEKECS